MLLVDKVEKRVEQFVRKTGRKPYNTTPTPRPHPNRVVGIIRNKILATIEEVLSMKFPFARDLGIIPNPFHRELFSFVHKIT